MSNEITKVDAPSPMAIISQLVSQLGGDGAVGAVAALETMVKLQREESDRQARRDFFTALNAFQRKCPAIPKDHEHQRTQSGRGAERVVKYAPLSTIERHVRPLLIENGFSWRWDTSPPENGTIRTTCYLMHVGGHAESASSTVAIDKNAPMGDAQRYGSTIAYGERYALVAVLGLVTVDDDDAQHLAADALHPIAEDQVAEIEHLLKSSGRERGKFLAWIGVQRVEDITQQQYASATAALRKAIGAKVVP